jgi:ELWxxDGT repeat protein
MELNCGEVMAPDAGTYMVKDIEPGLAASFVYIPNITALNGRLYFSAATSTNGLEPWVSDGTKSGTHLLKDVGPWPRLEFSNRICEPGQHRIFCNR